VPLRVLLADDSMTAQNMGKKILADAGFEVTAVSNGAAAVKKIEEVKPDVIILDVYMPGYTGLEVCERIRASDQQTPVLLTVGKLEPYRPEEGARVQANGLIVKPFEASDLIAAVRRLSEKKAAGAPLPTLPLPPRTETAGVPPPPKAGGPTATPATTTSAVAPPPKPAAPAAAATKPLSAGEPYDLPPLTEEDFAMLGVHVTPGAPSEATAAQIKAEDLPIFDLMEEPKPLPAAAPVSKTAPPPLDDILSLEPAKAADVSTPAVLSAPKDEKPSFDLMAPLAAASTPEAADPLLAPIVDFVPPAQPDPSKLVPPPVEHTVDDDILGLAELAPSSAPGLPEVKITEPAAKAASASAAMSPANSSDIDYATVAGVVQKVFDRFKPQLIAEIASELARMNKE